MHMNQSTQHDTYPRQRHLRPPPAPRKGADLPGLRGGPRECRAVGIPPLGGARGRFPFIIGNIKGPLISVRNLSLSLYLNQSAGHALHAVTLSHGDGRGHGHGARRACRRRPRGSRAWNMEDIMNIRYHGVCRISSSKNCFASGMFFGLGWRGLGCRLGFRVDSRIIWTTG